MTGSASTEAEVEVVRTRPTLLRRISGSPWAHLLAALVVLFLVQTFFVRLYYVPSASMQQTLDIGDRILVSRLGEPSRNLKAGDIVVFAAPAGWESAQSTSNPLTGAIKWAGGLIGVGPGDGKTLVKRVIAGPGQTVSCCDVRGRVIVDGHPLDEPYVYQNLPFEAGELDCASSPASARCFGTFAVPRGQYFVLGDHRDDSSDSIENCRGHPELMPGCVRTVPSSDVVGVAFQIVWPVSRWGPPAS